MELGDVVLILAIIWDIKTMVSESLHQKTISMFNLIALVIMTGKELIAAIRKPRSSSGGCAQARVCMLSVFVYYSIMCGLFTTCFPVHSCGLIN